MITKKHTALLAMAVCVLGLGALGSAKNPVARPVRLTGHTTVTINLSNGFGELKDWGEATHVGRFSNQASSTDGGVTWSGVASAPNGDQIFWVMPGGSWHTQFTGGTGRFEGSTGGFNLVSQSTPVVTFPEAGTMVVTYTYTGPGHGHLLNEQRIKR